MTPPGFSDSAKSAFSTALWSFIASVGLLSTNWLQTVAGWAQKGGHAPLPGISTIGYAVIGALVSSVSGLVAFIVRTAQSRNVLPGNAPAFNQPDPPPPGPTTVPVAALVPTPTPLTETQAALDVLSKLRSDWERAQAIFARPTGTTTYGASINDPGSGVLGGVVDVPPAPQPSV